MRLEQDQMAQASSAGPPQMTDVAGVNSSRSPAHTCLARFEEGKRVRGPSDPRQASRGQGHFFGAQRTLGQQHGPPPPHQQPDTRLPLSPGSERDTWDPVRGERGVPPSGQQVSITRPATPLLAFRQSAQRQYKRTLPNLRLAFPFRLQSVFVCQPPRPLADGGGRES